MIIIPIGIFCDWQVSEKDTAEVSALTCSKNRRVAMETINMETIIILMLVAFIAGLMLGVSLARPTITR